MRSRSADLGEELELLPVPDPLATPLGSSASDERGSTLGGAAGSVVSTLVFDRSGVVLPSWLEIDHRPGQIGTEYTVRRVIEADLQQTIAALERTHRDLLAQPSTHIGNRAVVRRGAASLIIELDPALVATDPIRLPAALPIRRCGPPEPVQLVIEPWSPRRTEVRLEIIHRHGRLRIPRRYFDVAHPSMSALRDELELRAGAAL